ncbi:hypothetical protein J8M21_20655 [Pseudoalteromonas luteoviolacea]|uniref:hypothetical protein n=1 Tax=Pseudoalteromonas luteoviolacea TaxID=43657 RepID=UPI001B3A200C|nr:hypothetical protein [Pseudoalteromonas luteoviolacea]MBQ4879632.1 hypothetical protein [Pseudoalteromonas luteoviolacea]MBQ4909162.1 hypothetical protein [Pseudoalteromonas luteoviolacea]
MRKKGTYNRDIECIHADAMESLSAEEYREHLQREGLFLVDSHDVLISAPAGYPIAVSKEQLEIYIEELQKIKQELP